MSQFIGAIIDPVVMTKDIITPGVTGVYDAAVGSNIFQIEVDSARVSGDYTYRG